MDSVIDAVFSTISGALANDKTVTIAGFGTFSTRARAARQGRNPKTGEPITIAASNAPAFKAGKALRAAVTVCTRTKPAHPSTQIRSQLARQVVDSRIGR